MEKIKIPIIKIFQKGEIFYIGKLKVEDLIKISTVKIRKAYKDIKQINYLKDIRERVANITYELEDRGIQRKADLKRLREIGGYLSSEGGIFPNSIIINFTPKDKLGYFIDSSEEGFIRFRNEKGEVILNLDESSSRLEFDSDKIVCTIIDGQHRLGGFAYLDNKKEKEIISSFELVITIFLGLEIPEQADLFKTINFKQEKVSKSLLYDLSELTEEEYTELKTCHYIAKWFNENEKSPWYLKIKMLGIEKEGILSQSAFIDGLLPHFEAKKSKRALPPVFRIDFKEKKEERIIQFLFDYFQSFKSVFEDQWLNKNYILTKTNGYGAIMKLLPYVYFKCFFYEDFSQGFIKETISKISNFKFVSTKYPAGGISIQNALFSDMSNKIFPDKERKDYENKFREYFSKYDY